MDEAHIPKASASMVFRSHVELKMYLRLGPPLLPFHQNVSYAEQSIHVIDVSVCCIVDFHIGESL